LSRCSEQRAAINQPAVHHGPGQQMHAGRRQRGPLGVDIPLAVRHHGYHRGCTQHLRCLLCRCQPTMRLPILEWAIPMVLGHDARSGPDLTAHQSKAGVGGGVHRDHRVHQHTISIPMLHRAEATPTLRRSREFDLGGIPGLRRGRLSIASTCRPAHAAPVPSDQPSTIFGAVTFLLAKNRPARSSPARLPPSRRKHTVLRATICSRIAPPLYRGADRRMSPATSP
jgi:hypothetical protein